MRPSNSKTQCMCFWLAMHQSSKNYVAKRSHASLLVLGHRNAKGAINCKTPATCPPSPQQLNGGGNETDHGRRPRCPSSPARCPPLISRQLSITNGAGDRYAESSAADAKGAAVKATPSASELNRQAREFLILTLASMAVDYSHLSMNRSRTNVKCQWVTPLTVFPARHWPFSPLLE